MRLLLRRNSSPKVFAGDAQGIAAVEFALMLPILVLFIACVFDVGRLLVDYQAVNKSTRDAVRFLSRADGSSAGLNIFCPGGTTVGTIDTTQKPALDAMDLAMTGLIGGDASTEPLVKSWNDDSSLVNAGITISVYCYDNTGSGGTSTIYEGIYQGNNEIPSINFEAEVPFRLALLSAFGLGPDITFTISHRMVHIGL